MCEYCAVDPRLKEDGRLVEEALSPEQREELTALVSEGMKVVGAQIMERTMLGSHKMSPELRATSIAYMKKMGEWRDSILKECSPEVAEVLFRRLPSLDNIPNE